MNERMEQIETTLHEDVSRLNEVKSLLSKCAPMHDSKLLEILMLVAGEIALREFELKTAARYKGLRQVPQPESDVMFPPIQE